MSLPFIDLLLIKLPLSSFCTFSRQDWILAQLLGWCDNVQHNLNYVPCSIMFKQVGLVVGAMLGRIIKYHQHYCRPNKKQFLIVTSSEATFEA